MKNEEEKKQIKGIMYEEEKMQQVINILSSIPVSGINNVNGMKIIFDILTNPVPFKPVEEVSPEK